MIETCSDDTREREKNKVATAAGAASPVDTASQAHHIAAEAVPVVGIDVVDRSLRMSQVSEAA